MTSIQLGAGIELSLLPAGRVASSSGACYTGGLADSLESFLGLGLTVGAGKSKLFDLPPKLFSRPEIRQDYPPNLSILISGGKENNCDALSNGE